MPELVLELLYNKNCFYKKEWLCDLYWLQSDDSIADPTTLYFLERLKKKIEL